MRMVETAQKLHLTHDEQGHQENVRQQPLKNIFILKMKKDKSELENSRKFKNKIFTIQWFSVVISYYYQYFTFNDFTDA